MKKRKKEKPERQRAMKEPIEKAVVLKNERGKKILRIILWVIVGFVMIRGIISIVTMPQTAQQRSEIEAYKNSISAEENIKIQAMGFAENFAREYFTYTGESNSDYVSRIEAFTAEGVNISVPGTVPVSATQVVAVGTEVASENRVDVDVSVTVVYPTVTKTVAIKVPVKIEEDRCAVIALPQFIPKTAKADISAETRILKGEDVGKTTAAEIKTVLESFLNTYYTGNENELTYYVTEDFPYTRGLEGSLQFESIRTANITLDAETGKYYALINFTVVDEGRTLDQMAYLTMKKNNGRYYISDIEAR